MSAAEKRVGIIGLGHVGELTRELFPDAVIYDKYIPQYCSAAARSAVAAVDVCFVCVPTPRAENGAADIRDVIEVCSWLQAPLVVLRSTVPPGTTDLVREEHGPRVVCWPEYIGRWPYPTAGGRSISDWPAFAVGGRPEDTGELIDLLVTRLGPEKTYRQAPAVQVELAKYMENSWLAVQVAFACEFRALADALGVGYWELRELWALDPRVVKTHSAAIRNQTQFGGVCLPKDLSAIVSVAAASGVGVPVLTAALSHADFGESDV